MAGYIKRDIYLQKLIDSRLNGFAKVVTGPRRCGKSWLLTRIYKDYLLADGVSLFNLKYLDNFSRKTSISRSSSL